MENFVEALHAQLTKLTSVDTAAIKSATSELNLNYFKNPACIPALANILASAPDPAIRQLAAVELRKRVNTKSGELWLQVPESERALLKSKLPEITMAESAQIVRHAIARVVAAIATIEVPNNTWPELLPFLHQTCMSPTVQARDVGIFMLFTVMENAADGWQKHINDYFQLFGQLLNDPESLEVRITTVRALGMIAQWLDADEKDHIKSFQALLPGMIQVIGQTLEADNEAGARQLFDIFETLLIIEIPLLGQHIPELVQFLIQCGGAKQYDAALRVLALNALNWTVQYKKSKVQAHVLAPPMLEGLFPIIAEEEPEDIDDEAPCRSALRIVDGLSTSLPPNQVFPALRNLVHQYFSSPDHNMRRAAMLALGISVEGGSEYLAPLMNEVWPLIEAGLQDAEPSVRKATCVTVSCLCEWVEDECSSKHQVLVPAIMNLINDEPTQKAACTALDALLEILHDVIDQYLNLIMERLAGLLDSAPIKVKAVVTGAIGSAAHASKGNFLPYFQPTMQRLQHFLLLTGEGEETELRGITMDAIGTFAEAVGRENFRPYFGEMMKQAFLGVQSGSARLRECSFLFFGVMARVFGAEFAPYLDNVMTPLWNSCKQAEKGDDFSSITTADLAAFSSGSGTSSTEPITLSDGSDISGEVEDLDLDKMMEVNSAIAVEKEIAADTIGTIFAATGASFLPYVENSVLELVELLRHYYEGIRKSATDSLLEIVRSFYDISEPADWTPGLATATPLSENVQKLVQHVFPALLEMFETEDDKSVVSALCVDFAETINKMGPAIVQPYLEPICNVATLVLQQKAFCQQDPDQDEEEEAPEDQAEYDSVLVTSAGDVVSSIANALGPDFAQLYPTFFPLISKFYKKNRSPSDRSSSIGCLAEIISGMKHAVSEHTEPLLELFHHALSDESPEVQSNAAFAVGVLIENSQRDLAAQYLPVLAALRPLFEVPEGAPPARYNGRDNAAGAVGRMITKNATAVPIEQVLPVVLSALPLKNDFLENGPVYRAIIHIFVNNSQAVVPHLDGLLRVFAHVLDPEQAEHQLDGQTREQLISLVGMINQSYPDKVNAAGLQAFA